MLDTHFGYIFYDDPPLDIKNMQHHIFTGVTSGDFDDNITNTVNLRYDIAVSYHS